MSNETNFRAKLQEHGLRYSRPREVILRYFGERQRHVSAEDLFQTLKQRGENLSLSTVYLNLGVLRDAGLVREFSGIGGEAYYDSNVEPHHHLICSCCGAIMDLPELELKGTHLSEFLKCYAEESSGWEIGTPSLRLHGTCRRCQDHAKD